MSLPKRIRKILIRTLSAALSPIYSGLGGIVYLHRVIEPDGSPRFAENTALEISPANLAAILADVQARGFQIVTLDQVHQILTRQLPPKKFIAFTFDDGYLDNLTLALPVFKKFAAPLALNLTTTLVGHDENVWWYRLEHILHIA